MPTTSSSTSYVQTHIFTCSVSSCLLSPDLIPTIRHQRSHLLRCHLPSLPPLPRLAADADLGPTHLWLLRRSQRLPLRCPLHQAPRILRAIWFPTLLDPRCRWLGCVWSGRHL